MDVFKKLLEPEPGTLLGGKYRVKKTLGVGGMGVVVEATHVALGHGVAVKLLRTSARQGDHDRARFLREARIAAQLRSEHIAKVADIGETEDGTPFVVMELLEGRDLADELEARGPLPIDEAVTHMLAACEALAEAHASGLVHRDVKPANLFLARRPHGRAPHIKVLDFGLSKASGVGMAELTQTAGAFGTPLYMSPEQIASTKHVDSLTDQYALGLVLYELLTGRPAYKGRNPAEIATNIITTTPKPIRDIRPEVPAALAEACTRAMAKEHARRFPDLGAFARALAAFAPDGESRLMAIDFALVKTRPVAGASGIETLAPDPALEDESTVRRVLEPDDAKWLHGGSSGGDSETRVMLQRAPAPEPPAPLRYPSAAEEVLPMVSVPRALPEGGDPAAPPGAVGGGADPESLPAWWTILAGFAIALSVVYVTIWLATQGAP